MDLWRCRGGPPVEAYSTPLANNDSSCGGTVNASRSSAPKEPSPSGNVKLSVPNSSLW
jgi:hypothetical protein